MIAPELLDIESAILAQMRDYSVTNLDGTEDPHYRETVKRIRRQLRIAQVAIVEAQEEYKTL